MSSAEEPSCSSLLESRWRRLKETLCSQLALGPYDADHRHVARFPLAQAPVNYNVAPFVAANPQVVQSFQPKAFGRTSLANNLTPKPNFDRRHSSFVPGRGSENDAAAANHCNAYILNLSLDMTNDALEKLCAEYGEVKHVCILATLDNAGRFVGNTISPSFPC